MNHYCDIWFWRASDQEAVARHLTDRTRITGEPDTRRRAGPVRSALLSILRTAGLTEQPVQASPVKQEETPVRESCGCGGEEEFQYRELYSTRDSGFSDAPSADTWIACSGSRTKPGLSCWDWHGGGSGCR